MDPRRFDALTRALVRDLPRRRLLDRLGIAALAAFVGHQAAPGNAAARQEDTASVSLPCAPCNCGAGGCQCCLIGITGGGVVRTETGDTNLVLFATELGEDAPQQAAGFVRWIDPNVEGGLTLESVGPIAYGPVPETEQTREVRGLMMVNGAGEHAFRLEVFDAGPERQGTDTARLFVGDRAAEGGTGSGFGYASEGTLVGGDLQLLSSVAPISPP